MAAQPMESWLDVEKPISTPVEAEFFSLTSLFIELIELVAAIGVKIGSGPHPFNRKADWDSRFMGDPRIKS
jgi:hypothetical protein